MLVSVIPRSSRVGVTYQKPCTSLSCQDGAMTTGITQASLVSEAILGNYIANKSILTRD